MALHFTFSERLVNTLPWFAPYVNSSESVALWVPVALPGGADSTPMPQVPFGARGCPEHGSLDILKDPGSLPPSIAVPNVTVTVLGFDNTIFFGVPMLPALTGANDADFGALSVAAMPMPFRVTRGLVPLYSTPANPPSTSPKVVGAYSTSNERQRWAHCENFLSSFVALNAGALDTGLVTFSNGAWSATVPSIAIFDATFVSENVYSGDTVDIEHKRSLYRLIVGKQGVALAQQIDALDAASRAKSTEIRENAAAIQAHVPQGVTLDVFLALAEDPAIDEKIATAGRELEAVRQTDQIKTRASLSAMTLPSVPANFEMLLAKTIEGIADDAGRLVAEQIHEESARPRKGATAISICLTRHAKMHS
jgi:hypothetical protein